MKAEAGNRSDATPETGALAEMTGLRGAFVFPERLLQRIWSRGDFNQRGLRLRDGRPLRIVRRGRWNGLAGPDFFDGEFRVGEGGASESLRGDVEVHLRAGDWDQHGHAHDPAYDGVVLHVVLFPATREWTCGRAGRRVPILELLPLLGRDLEAYAEEAAVEGLAGRPASRLRAALAHASAERIAAEVSIHALRRWERKVALARAALEARGWEQACHQSAMEVLGYRFNRDPMNLVAERWPLAEWRAGRVGVEEAWQSEQTRWRSAGVRPANQPRARLSQYLAWVNARPDWPDRLAELGLEWGAAWACASEAARAAADSTQRSRRRRGLAIAHWRKRLSAEVAAGCVGGTRIDTLICDSWLPLLAARFSAAPEMDATIWQKSWMDWPPGDAPSELLRLAREYAVGAAGAPSGLPVGDVLGQGDLQGLLGWLSGMFSRGGESESSDEGRGT